MFDRARVKGFSETGNTGNTGNFGGPPNKGLDRRDVSPGESSCVSKKNLAGESQSAIVHCRPVLAIAAVAHAYRKCPPIQRFLRAARFCRPKLQFRP